MAPGHDTQGWASWGVAVGQRGLLVGRDWETSLWSQGPLEAAGSGWVPHPGLVLISEMHGKVQSQPACPKNPRSYLPPCLQKEVSAKPRLSTNH